MIVPIYPPLDGITAERFPIFARALAQAQSERDSARVVRLLQEEVDWCASAVHIDEHRLVYEACIRVLSDLIRLRWRLVEQGYGFALENPKERRRGLATPELVASKAALRDELKPAVQEQFTQPSVQDFLKRMETNARGKLSVLTLIAEGTELQQRLLPARRLSGPARVDALRLAIRPYLQRATEVPDEITGQSLREVWRYFRYQWSIPQVAVPGRQLLYLVRDAAHPKHPVIGIASLNNCALEMGEARETYIGWHRRALMKRFATAVETGMSAIEGEVKWLEERLSLSLGEVDWTNLVTADDVRTPTDQIIRKLVRKGQDFAQLREELLRESASADSVLFQPELWESDSAPPVNDEVLRLEAKASANSRMHAARKQLIAKKRAHALGRLLQAKLVLNRTRQSLIDPMSAMSTLEREDVRSAINIILEALKARRAGANMLEITTCGAIFPYAPMLGGKLVSLLMLSPEIAADYKATYDSPSIISSQMRNQPVIRDNALVYLGTTSLYLHGSSQYNRLTLPAGTIAEDQPEIRYFPVGETTGFGTVQFSSETSRIIDALLSERNAYKEVNSVFGEGTSPKLRKLKSGLRMIGFEPERLLRHRQQRLIYGSPMFEEARDWLMERTTNLPSYLASPERFRDSTQNIVEFWRSRWLAKRLDHENSFLALGQKSPTELAVEDSVSLEPV